MPRKSKAQCARYQNIKFARKSCVIVRKLEEPNIDVSDIEMTEEQIIRERGLWPTMGARNLLAQCKDFKCKEGATTCCCRRILFTQPDFVNQKSELEEYIVLRGHICNFYPKFHWELNFIEQYWGAAKYHYHVTPRTANMEEMRANVLACLDDVPLLQIQWLAHSEFVYSKLQTNSCMF